VTGTLLVVDDQEQNRLLAEAQLTAAGYDVKLTASGPETLALLAEDATIELICLDVMMPGMDGFETCRRVRDVPAYADVPVLFLTASHETTLHERAIASGGDDFLRKPIDRTELLLRVRSLIRIARLQRTLRAERDALVRLQAQKDLLTDLLVHDLKNPLSGILANAQFALDGADADARAAIEDVISAAENMQRMVVDLLDIGRAEDGGLATALADVDLAAVIARLERQCARKLEHRRQRVERAGNATIRADEGLVARVLQNLLDNAMRYAPAGSAIAFEIAGAGDKTRVRVRDTGPGIPAEARAKIFEKYGQVDGGGGERTSRGLGLHFCRLATEAHGGRIWVEDNAPRGTTFVVELPTGVIA
jgi:signal transduction histidine kinase